MLKKLGLALIALLFIGGISSQALAADFKVGIVDLQTLLKKSPQVQKIRDDLKKQFDPQDKKLAAAQQDFQKAVEKRNKDAATMSPKERTKTDQDLLGQQQKLQQQQMEFQKTVTEAQNKALQDFLGKVKDAVAKVSKKEGYNLVLLKAEVIYNDEKTEDLTDQVMKNL
jgi:outer membrane protein